MNAIDTTVDRPAPSRMVVLMYEEAIASLDRAAAAVEKGDVNGRCRHIERAVSIVTLLYGCLDLDRGGEVADSLARYYRVVLGRLVIANARTDSRYAREAAELMRPLLTAWRELDAEPAPALPIGGDDPARAAQLGA